MFRIDSGEMEGVDVGGVTIASVLDPPKVMTDGDWRMVSWTRWTGWLLLG